MFEDIIDIINEGLERDEQVQPEVACYTCSYKKRGWSKQPCKTCLGSKTKYSKWTCDLNYMIKWSSSMVEQLPYKRQT